MADGVASAAVIAGGVAVMFVHYYAGSPGDPEGWFAALGFAAPFIGAGFLALVGTLRGQPALIFAAAVALIPMSVLSIVLIPLLIPAVLLMVHATSDGFAPRDLALPAILAFALAAALTVLVFHQDPVTWSTPESSGGSSNIVTTSEATLAIAAAVAVAILAVLLPRKQRPAG